MSQPPWPARGPCPGCRQKMKSNIQLSSPPSSFTRSTQIFIWTKPGQAGTFYVPMAPSRGRSAMSASTLDPRARPAHERPGRRWTPMTPWGTCARTPTPARARARSRLPRPSLRGRRASRRRRRRVRPRATRVDRSIAASTWFPRGVARGRVHEILVAGRAVEDAKPSFGGRAVGVGAQRREGEG